MPEQQTGRPILAAELLSVGAELTVGETADTNAPEIARELTARGVHVRGIHALPDELELVRAALSGALERADLVVATGGLGPTPDDLTREAIAAATGEQPVIDDQLERWLRELWARRGLPFPEINLKQAWLIPSATAVPNDNGTAPGWWVERPDGRVVVALPGPPREMRPMWRDWVRPRLEARGLGLGAAVRTLRLFGIGESQLAHLLGEEMLRAPNPVVATYARADAVDVRISAVDEPSRTATAIGEAAETAIRSLVGEYVWGMGGDTWPGAIGAALAERGWSLATSERGTDGALVALLGSLPAVVYGELRRDADDDETPADAAARVRAQTGADLGLAVRALDRGDDTGVSIAIASEEGVREERRVAFLRGDVGRSRAALTCASALLGWLRGGDAATVVSGGRQRPERAG